MIVYYKLANILNERSMTWKDLCKADLSQNMPTRFSKNENVNSDTINKVCEYLKVQPSEIMEWIPDAEYAKQSEKEAEILAQIDALKKQLDEIKQHK